MKRKTPMGHFLRTGLRGVLTLFCLSLALPASVFAQPIRNSEIESLVLSEWPSSHKQAKRVSLKDFEKLKTQYAGRSIQITKVGTVDPTDAADNNTNHSRPHIQAHSPNTSSNCKSSEPRPSTKPSVSSSPSDSSSPFYLNWTSSSSFDSGKDVLIFFAVIGVVIVAALVVYSVGFLLKAVSMGYRCKTWSRWGLRFSYISDSNANQIRNGHMTGLNYSLAYEIPSMTFVLVGELGHFDMELDVLESGLSKKFDGPYFLFGPGFQIPISSRALQFNIELMAGTTTDKEIGLMSTLRFGLDLRMSANVQLGLSFGGALINVKTFNGLLTEIDQINYLSGINLATQF